MLKHLKYFQFQDERLYKEEYWPELHVFNPIKCRYLGINRLYCKTRTYPVAVNLARLADKFIPTYGPPPPRKTEEERELELMADLLKWREDKSDDKSENKSDKTEDKSEIGSFVS